MKVSLIAKLTLKITIFDDYKVLYIFETIIYVLYIFVFKTTTYSMKKLTITQLTIMSTVFYNRVFGTTPQILRKVLQDVAMT